MKLNRLKFTAASCDQQPFPMNKCIRDFLPCAFIYCRDGCPGNIHTNCAGFLCKPFIIQKSQGLKLIHIHSDAFNSRDVIR